jgi:putative autoinducer-2 (AI-2) aldolase
MVKLKVPQPMEGLQRIVAGAGIPVFAAGGDRLQDDDAFLDWFATVMEQPVAGAVIGRNLFQSQNPAALLAAMAQMIDNQAVAGRCVKLREQVA